MARTLPQIQSQIIADVQADTTLSGLTSTSKFAIWRSWTFIFATAIYLLENIIDIFKSDTETSVKNAAAGSPSWVSDKMFKFQYDLTVPQVIILINEVPQYVPVDITKRIISRVSVRTTLSNICEIKLAQQEPPISLTTAEISSAQGYINTIGVAGVDYLVSSGDADRIYIGADVYCDGQYASTILQSITDAFNTFFATQGLTNFGGSIKVSDLELVVRSVTGVNDIILKNVSARANVTAFPGTGLVVNAQTISRLWQPTTGYAILEDTSGQTLANSLNLIVT